MSAPAQTPLTYNSYVTAVATLAVVNVQTVNGVVVDNGDPNFSAIIPSMLDYAELRIARDLDLNASLTSNSYNLIANNPVLSISSNDFVTIQTLGVTNGTVTTQLLPTSKEFIQSVYNDTSYTDLPQYFAMIGGDPNGGNTLNNILVGPIPDQNYPISAMGTVRLPTLYSFANPDDAATGTTWISTNLPDMLIQASLVYISQYQRNFLATSSDPQMPGSYESQYQTLLGRALVEEARKKFQASAWSSMSPPSVASPTR